MRMLNLNDWLRLLRNPVVFLGLAVDLAPVFAVIFWGWRAAPLVILYWMENVVIGVMTPPRMIFVATAKAGLSGLLGGLFMSAFFVLHYGMFCFVHGVFLFSFLTYFNPQTTPPGDVPFDLGAMFAASSSVAPHLGLILGLIIAFQLFVFVYSFILRGEWKNSGLSEEMMAPYGRVVVLHIGIFAGAAGLVLLGDPMAGVLALILLRAVWGVHVNMKARKSVPDKLALAKAGAA
ncbi:MAG: hypothetical protein GC155_18025 [Alphaproteobacteria bacterium]|nr:hypothetical protein [Alphaproteobacteria bacterium]